MERTFGIGSLAQEFSITPRTIRHYEEIGLLEPARAGRRRIYSLRDRTRLKLILRGRRVGFTLEEIRDILGLYDQADGEAGQLSYLLARIAERRDLLLARRADIDATLGELAEIAARCRSRLAQLEAPSAGEKIRSSR